MGNVKRMWEEQVEAGLIDPEQYDGPGNPDTVGHYPGEPEAPINEGTEDNGTIPF